MPVTWLKRDSNTCAFLWVYKIFKNAYCEEQLQMAASEFLKIVF